MKKTYKCFGEALDDLRVESDLSYDRLALKLDIANSYVYHIINRRSKSAPSNEIIEKIAGKFGLEPEYFFEYRLRKMIAYVEDNKKFLDHCENLMRKYSNANEPAKRERSNSDSDATNSDTEEYTA